MPDPTLQIKINLSPSLMKENFTEFKVRDKFRLVGIFNNITTST